jgi:hypothetical protein
MTPHQLRTLYGTRIDDGYIPMVSVADLEKVWVFDNVYVCPTRSQERIANLASPDPTVSYKRIKLALASISYHFTMAQHCTNTPEVSMCEQASVIKRLCR